METQIEPPPNDSAARERLAVELAKVQSARPEAEPVAQDAGEIAAALARAFLRNPPSDAEAVKRYAWKHELAEKLELSRVPQRYRYQMTEWGCPKQEGAFQLCLNSFTGHGAIIALIGERGCGKTTIAAQLTIARLWEDWHRLNIDNEPGFLWRNVPYRKMSDLIARFKPLYADFGSLDMDTLIQARASYCSDNTLAIIDELHDCEDQRLKDRVLTDILDRRYSEMNDTLLISNQSEKAFRESVSDSVLSRISEHGMIVPCEWGSFREGDMRALATNSKA